MYKYRYLFQWLWFPSIPAGDHGSKVYKVHIKGVWVGTNFTAAVGYNRLPTSGKRFSPTTKRTLLNIFDWFTTVFMVSGRAMDRRNG